MSRISINLERKGMVEDSLETGGGQVFLLALAGCTPDQSLAYNAACTYHVE